MLAELDPMVLEYEQLFANNLTLDELEQLNTLVEKYRTINI